MDVTRHESVGLPPVAAYVVRVPPSPVLLGPCPLTDDQFLAALVESSDDAILGVTPEGAVVSWNGGAERLFGYTAAEVLGQRLPAAIFPEGRSKEIDVLLTHVLRGETVRDFQTVRLRRDGASLDLTVTASPVIAPDGTVAGASLIARDVTTQVRTVEELRRSERSGAETLSLLETLQRTAPVGFGFVDRELRITRVNKFLAALTGLTTPDARGRARAPAGAELSPELETIVRRVLETGAAVVDVELSGESLAEPGATRYGLGSFYPVVVGNELTGVGVVVVDTTERRQAEESQKALTRASVAAIASAGEARDPYTAGHQSRVATLASAIAAELGLDAHTIEGVDLGALIHDIGKIRIPVEILTRSTPLVAPEWELVKTHSTAGADIVRGIDFPWPIAAMIEQHHERLDGSGYPHGLSGEGIEPGAHIIAIADVVDAMASHRPYRPARGLDAALEEIENGRGRLFEPSAVNACLRLFREGRIEQMW